MIYNNQASVCKCFDGMTGVGRHDGNYTGLGNLRSPIDGDFLYGFPLESTCAEKYVSKATPSAKTIKSKD